MSHIGHIRIKNLRAVEDTGDIALKPITILVGRNSVGKSTLARVFPLLRQSYGEQRRAPLLWWGKYVDFGSFNDVVRRGASPQEVSISFGVTLDPSVHFSFFDEWEEPLALEKATEFAYCVDLAAAEGNTYVKRITVSHHDLSCSIDINPDGSIYRIVSGAIEWVTPSDVLAQITMGELVPNIRYLKLAPKDASLFHREIKPLRMRLVTAIYELAHKNTKIEQVDKIIKSVQLASAASVLHNLKSAQSSKFWRRAMSELTVEDPRLENLRRLKLMSALPALLRKIAAEVRGFSLGVRYLEPLRATALRYYRVQELAVDEIDSKGSNLAVFIHSMSIASRESFNRWLFEHLNFMVEPSEEGGHISLKVKFAAEDAGINLADTGFGMSQVLPIATQLWSSLSQDKIRETDGGTRCFVVEQPELHLHPAFQDRIADIFVAAANAKSDASLFNRRRPFPIIAETHSSNLINRLGELVAEGAIDKEDVQIILFDQGAPNTSVQIRVSQFDKDGVLQNWPFGFFSSGGLR